MTTVIAGNHTFEVDTKHEDIHIVFDDLGRITVKQFTCDGYKYEDQKLLDYLLEQAREIESENANENFNNNHGDYIRESADA